jgi:hypothetical protein
MLDAIELYHSLQNIKVRFASRIDSNHGDYSIRLYV